MNWIKRLFRSKKERQSATHKHSPLKEHEQLLISKVIELLNQEPDAFSAKWFSGKNIDESVRYKNIYIMINTGQIISPSIPEMTYRQRSIVKELVAPIVERDSKYLIEKLVS